MQIYGFFFCYCTTLILKYCLWALHFYAPTQRAKCEKSLKLVIAQHCDAHHLIIQFEMNSGNLKSRQKIKSTLNCMLNARHLLDIKIFKLRFKTFVIMIYNFLIKQNFYSILGKNFFAVKKNKLQTHKRVVAKLLARCRQKNSFPCRAKFSLLLFFY